MIRTARINFTKTALTGLPVPPSGRRATYWDSKTRGLALLVTSAGAKTFYVRRKLKGRSERVRIGRLSEWSVERARAAADEINAACGRGENPAESVRTKRCEMTLDDLFKQYMECNGPHLRRPDKPRNNYRLYLSGWGNRKLSSIKHHEVDRLHKDLAKAKSNVTANIALKLLHVMFNKAINEWRIYAGDNPARGIRKLREISRDRFLQPEEMPVFLMAVALEPSPDPRDLVQLALLTGARRANLLAMRWDELRLDAREWRIAETKNGTSQLLPLTIEAVDVLLRREQSRDSSPWVFPGTGKTSHLIEIKSYWKRLLARAELLRIVNDLFRREELSEGAVRQYVEQSRWNAGVALAALQREARGRRLSLAGSRFHDLRFHDLRRTLGSWQARTGASLVVIGKSLNHKSPASTAVYARLDLEPVRLAFDRATAEMWRAAGLATPEEPAAA